MQKPSIPQSSSFASTGLSTTSTAPGMSIDAISTQLSPASPPATLPSPSPSINPPMCFGAVRSAAFEPAQEAIVAEQNRFEYPFILTCAALLESNNLAFYPSAGRGRIHAKNGLIQNNFILVPSEHKTLEFALEALYLDAMRHGVQFAGHNFSEGKSCENIGYFKTKVAELLNFSLEPSVRDVLLIQLGNGYGANGQTMSGGLFKEIIIKALQDKYNCSFKESNSNFFIDKNNNICCVVRCAGIELRNNNKLDKTIFIEGALGAKFILTQQGFQSEDGIGVSNTLLKDMVLGTILEKINDVHQELLKKTMTDLGFTIESDKIAVPEEEALNSQRFEYIFKGVFLKKAKDEEDMQLKYIAQDICTGKRGHGSMLTSPVEFVMGAGPVVIPEPVDCYLGISRSQISSDQLSSSTPSSPGGIGSPSLSAPSSPASVNSTIELPSTPSSEGSLSSKSPIGSVCSLVSPKTPPKKLKGLFDDAEDPFTQTAGPSILKI